MERDAVSRRQTRADQTTDLLPFPLPLQPSLTSEGTTNSASPSTETEISPLPLHPLKPSRPPQAILSLSPLLPRPPTPTTPSPPPRLPSPSPTWTGFSPAGKMDSAPGSSLLRLQSIPTQSLSKLTGGRKSRRGGRTPSKNLASLPPELEITILRVMRGSRTL